MGNYVEGSEFRGDLDVKLTAMINSMTDENFEAFLEECEEAGHLEKDQYSGKKSSLIENLANFDDATKNTCIQSLGKGKVFD